MTLSLFAALALSAAGGWDATFVPGVAVDYLPQPRGRVFVARSGPPSGARDAAAEALVRALRASGKPMTVMGDEQFEPLGDLDDQAIVARCVDLPVDQVVVVRGLPGDGEAPEVSVRLYDLSGMPRGAFAAREGEPLPPHEFARPPPADVPAAEPASPQEAYDRSYIYFDTHEYRDEDGTSTITQLVQGRYKHPLTPDQLYRLAGRDDLARAHQRAAAIRTGAFVGGLALLVVGPLASTGFMLWWPKPQASACQDTPGSNLDDCIQQADKAGERNILLGITGALVSTGVGSLLVVYGVSSPEVQQDDEDRALVEQYNRRLREHLGLPNSARAQAPARLRFSLAPMVGPGQGGALLRLEL